MSTALRIASVTHVLKDLLNNGLIDHDLTGSMGGNVTVTALPPDRIAVKPNEPSQLNLFMYKITSNQGWQNVGLPSLNGRGERISNPPLAIDLHYLLTAYGSGELHTDILLGYGMQLFHETMVLGRDAIRRSLAPPSAITGTLPEGLKLLSTSELAEQAEQIKITSEFLSIEDISKLWSAFQTGYFRPSVAYKVTVVLIESRKSTKPGLPVQARNIYVKPFKKPEINNILSQAAAGEPVIEDQKVLPGFRLILRGKQFNNEVVEVSIDGDTIDDIASDLEVDDSEISFNLTGDNLKSGLHEIQIVHPMLMGSPPAPHKGVVSKTGTFILSPTITGGPDATDIVGSGDALRSAVIKLKVNPAVYPGQRVVLLINEKGTGADLRSYSFQMPAHDLLSPPELIEDISIKIKGVKKGDYLLRIAVDGADSPLKANAAGVYISPAITIP
jgi:hypothetical protein